MSDNQEIDDNIQQIALITDSVQAMAIVCMARLFSKEEVDGLFGSFKEKFSEKYSEKNTDSILGAQQEAILTMKNANVTIEK